MPKQRKEKKEVKLVQALLKSGLARLARAPKLNPSHFDFGHYTVPIVAEDYPAKTPAMWNVLYQRIGIVAGNIMIVVDPDNVEVVLDVFREDPYYLGGGVGVGLKEGVIPFLDEIDSLAGAIGAVNFITKTSENRLKGFNTDGIGYVEGLKEVLSGEASDQSLRGKKVVITGAGGSANAIAFSLAQDGAKVVIVNRTLKNAELLADGINKYFALPKPMEVKAYPEDSIMEHVSEADVLVNVSIKGAAGVLANYSALAPANLPETPENISKNLMESDIIFSEIPRTTIISDIVLSREDTPMIKRAKELGYKTMNGIPMVVNQGVEAFWLLYRELLEGMGISRESVKRIMLKAALD